MDKTSLGDRMKEYERIYDSAIIRRIPVIVRCDGKGFSKWTKKLKLQKPFDNRMCDAMMHTIWEVGSKIEGCVFAYTQSDEMTFVLCNDQSNESEPWFGNRVQKIASVVSSMVTAHFGGKMSGPLAYFDTRVFGVPTWQEAINCLVWRQNDATKNSVSAACYYEVAKVVGKKTARKMMHGLNGKEQQELLFQQTGINWNDYPTRFKRGTACYRKPRTLTNDDGEEFERNVWEWDQEIPVFTKDKDFLYNILVKED